mmetsp:Transcript_11056/g.22879  ORF Transcript_11056/g.22879 Transcript_11056/m.22879 type:complete len:94 (+) Transcript_11056:172-453(+)
MSKHPVCLHHSICSWHSLHYWSTPLAGLVEQLETQANMPRCPWLYRSDPDTKVTTPLVTPSLPVAKPGPVAESDRSTCHGAGESWSLPSLRLA